MAAQKVSLEQMGRQYLAASNLEMARLIVAKTGVYSGKCLELSAGVGYLGFALSESTMLDVYLLENNHDAIIQARNHIARSELSDRINLIKGSICKIPLVNESMDLVTSKKSIFSWNNRVAIFKEVYRVLAPGGVACFCGGFESEDIKFQVNARLAKYNPKLASLVNGRVYSNHYQNFEKVLEQTGIPLYEINCQANGMWIVFSKPSLKTVSRGPLRFTYLGPPKTTHSHESASL
jgi:ubiquinone/menaquinone biosynthesis C-methylase UbiE